MEPPDRSDEVLKRARSIALALPETKEVTNDLGGSFRIRNRVFAFVLSVDDPEGRRIPMLVCNADPEERQVLAAIGHPYFAPRHNQHRIGVIIEDTTDWTELAELITESYRLLAPKKLAETVDAPPVV